MMEKELSDEEVKNQVRDALTDLARIAALEIAPRLDGMVGNKRFAMAMVLLAYTTIRNLPDITFEDAKGSLQAILDVMTTLDGGTAPPPSFFATEEVVSEWRH